MTVFDFYAELEKLYPRSLSCPWDNDGLMIAADLSREVKRVAVALDATDDLLLAAGQNGFDTVLVHHPTLFRGAKTVTPATYAGRRVLDAVRLGLSVICLHTRLDAGEGGVNECLCRALGFEPSGVFGDDEAPTLARYADVPAMNGEELAALVKEKLGVPFVKVTGPLERSIRRIGFCGGDGKELVPLALAAGCGAFVTGDAGYNMALDAGEDGLVTVEAGHYHTEFPVCERLADLARRIAGAEAVILPSRKFRIL